MYTSRIRSRLSLTSSPVCFNRMGGHQLCEGLKERRERCALYSMPPIIELINLSLCANSTVLFHGTNAQMTDTQRVALAGPNGAGKSSLLRAIAEHSRYNNSDNSYNTHTTTADSDWNSYLHVSTGKIRLGENLLENSNTGCPVLWVEQDKLSWSALFPSVEDDEDTLQSMTVPELLDYAACSGEYTAVEDVGSWRQLVIAAEKWLDWKGDTYTTTPIHQLSPGCALRAYLAIALQRVEVKALLLDEPTNHLDLSSIIWLEQAIITSQKAMIIVSHDVAFLDRVADHVWFLDPRQALLQTSRAQCSAFYHSRDMARLQQQEAHDKQQARHQRLTQVAGQLRTASTAGSHYTSRDHDTLQRDFKRERAGRSGHKAKSIEVRRDQEVKIHPVEVLVPLRLGWEVPGGGGSDSHLSLMEVALSHGAVPLPLPPISMRVNFGEHVVIVGENGVGKSTLLQTLLGVCPLAKGRVVVGRALRVGNLTQLHQSMPLDVVARSWCGEETKLAPWEAGQLLIKHGLTRRQVDQTLSALNPGARVRCLFASFAARKVNALVLDEPSNHLDEEALSALVGALNEFEGTVLVISHHRSFLTALRVSKFLRLSHNGLNEVESFDSLLQKLDLAAQKVVSAWLSV